MFLVACPTKHRTIRLVPNTVEHDAVTSALIEVDTARDVLRSARADFQAARHTLSKQLHAYLTTLTESLTDEDLRILVHTDADPRAGLMLGEWFAGMHPAFGAYQVNLELAEDFSDLPSLAAAFETVTTTLARVDAPVCMEGYIFSITVNGAEQDEFFLARRHHDKSTLALIDDSTGEALTPMRSDVLTGLMLAVEYFTP